MSEVTPSLLQNAGKEIATKELRTDLPIFYKLAEKLKPAIENGDYNLIIGDDIRGRIPALVFTGLMNRVNLEKNKPPVQLVFLPGLRTQQNTDAISDLNREFQKRKPFIPTNQPQNRALLVTEHLLHGRTLDAVSQVLAQNGIDFDVAALGIEGEESFYRKLEHFPATSKLFYGVCHDEPRLGEVPEINGVQKADNGEVKKREGIDQSLINQSRQDVQKIIDILSQHVFQTQATAA